MKYVIEHMEEGFSSWVRLEYRAISKEVGSSGLFLTSIKPTVQVPEEISSVCTSTPLEVTQLKEIDANFDISKVCLLDPSAEQELVPEDAAKFDYFLFGGILGDHPPRDRTGELRKLGFAGRHLGKTQMTTDTAVRVTQRVIENGQKLDEIDYIDFPELRFNKHESTEMPFRYIKNDKGEPIMPEGMFELIKEDSEKSLEDML